MKDLIKLQQDSKTDENILTLLIRRACGADYEDSCIFMRTASSLSRNQTSRPRGCVCLPLWPHSLFLHRCIRWRFSHFSRLQSRADSLLGCSSFPPTFLLIRIQYLPAMSAMLPEVKKMVLNGPCGGGRAVKTREPLHDRRRTAGQGALSGVVGAVWVLRRSETEIANSTCAF